VANNPRDDDTTARTILSTVHAEARPWATSWFRSLRADGKSYRTIENYLATVREFSAWCAANDHPVAFASQTPANVRQWIVEQLDDRSPTGPAVGTVVLRFRCLQQWFRWLVEEDELAVSPMAKMKAPKATDERPVPVLTDEQLRALLHATRGKDWMSSRDHAIIRLFIDSGMRLGEMVGIRVQDVDLEAQVVLVVGKGARHRIVPFGSKTAEALDRYERVRNTRPQANEPQWWLGTRGTIGHNGIAAMLQARADQAGIGHLHAHQFRHTAAHRWLKMGGTESDLMRNAGWANSAMLQRYGRSAAAERAREAHRRIAPGDSL